MLLLLAAVLFLGHGSRTISAPFGDSHDGRNAGVWAAGSRSLREHGPVSSRLGTRSPEAGVYANHPPLIYVETAAAELVGFGRAAATRAPAWLGSLFALALLWRLLTERGLRTGAAGVAVLLAGTTPMFLVYGTMLDTPVTSLPFGVALLLLWERARRDEAVRPVSAATLAALAVLAGWQAALLAVVIGAWALVRVVRRTGRRELNLAFAAGAGAGLALLLCWVLWAHGGSLRPLLDQFVVRTGQSSSGRVGFGAFLRAQGRIAMTMFGVVGLIAVAGIIVALRDAATRSVAALTLAVTVPYLVLFRSGAVNHDYWGYWLLLPMVVGLGAGAEALLDFLRSRGGRESVIPYAAALLACVFAVTAWSAPEAAERSKLHGFRAGHVTEDAHLAPGQSKAWFAGAVGIPPAWLVLTTRNPPQKLTESQFGALASTRPAEMVLVGEVRCIAGVDEWTYEYRTAAQLLHYPPAFAVCGSRTVTNSPQPGLELRR